MDVTSQALLLVGKQLEVGLSNLGDALIHLGTREQLGELLAIEVPRLGISAGCDLSGIVRTIHLYAGGVDGYSEFPFSFRGVRMNSSRMDLKLACGNAIEEGYSSEEASRILVPNWFVYRLEGVRVHVEYFDEIDRIRLVTLTEWPH